MHFPFAWVAFRTGAVGFLMIALGALSTNVSHAQVERYDIKKHLPAEDIYPDWTDCGLRKIDTNAFVSHRMSETGRQGAKAATIQVNYGSGFTTEAQDAFQRAVDVWETHIESNVTIRIDASFEPLAEGVLGGARPQLVHAADTNNDGEADVYFGDALIDAITGTDQNAGGVDIVAQFNSDREDWHFAEEDAPANTIDFTTVALHEIGHGLHYFEQSTVNGGEGEYGVDFGANANDIPSIFTLFLAEDQGDGSLISLTNESVFPNPSEELGDALTGDQLVFDAEKANVGAAESTGPVPPIIYAPNPFESGSSISHLDEDTYPEGGTNALMTPSIAAAETNRLPGPIVCGQLGDMGWPLGTECAKFFPVTNFRFADSGASTPGSVTLTWTEGENANIQEYKIERKYFDDTFEIIKEGISSPPVTLSSLGLGKFTFRIRWVNNDGTETVSAQEVSTTVNFESVTLDASKGERGRGTVDFSWTVPPGTVDGPRSFSYYVERARGSDTNYERLELTSQPKASQQYTGTVDRQPPGRYKYRIAAVDGAGNAVRSDSQSVEISFDGTVFIAGPFPNPVHERASVELTAKDQQNVAVGIYNALGEEVYFERRQIQERRPTRLNVDTARWGSGLYLLRVTGTTFTRTQKFMVVR